MIKVSHTTADIINFERLIKVPHIYFDNSINGYDVIFHSNTDIRVLNLALKFTRKLNNDIKPFSCRTKRGG